MIKIAEYLKLDKDLLETEWENTVLPKLAFEYTVLLIIQDLTNYDRSEV